jgi:hypothetical protein
VCAQIDPVVPGDIGGTRKRCLGMVPRLLTDARETSYWIRSSLLTAERSTVELPGTSLFCDSCDAACSELAEASSPSNEEDEVIARICDLAHRLGYNQAKTKMLLGQWGRYLVSLERSLLSELEDLLDGSPNSLATSSRHEKSSSTEGLLSLDDKLIRRYE